MAVSLARERGLKFDGEAAKEQLRTMVTVRLPERESLLQGVARGGAPMRDSLMLMGLAAEKYTGDPLTVAFTHMLASMQSQDGAWYPHIMRQPLEHSAFSETAYAIRALQLYGPAGRKPEFEKRIARARSWLLAHTPNGNEDRVKQLLGLAWSGAQRDEIRKAAAQLVSEQQPDGGWAQRAGFASDAYATGQTLYALHVGAGLPTADPMYKRGVEYLRSTQHKDGSWYVRSRSVKFQPYFDSGFPHEHDQWISAAATAWATMAVMLGLDVPTAASR
jgi:squalene cyclase